jgi:hypothetical protein
MKKVITLKKQVANSLLLLGAALLLTQAGYADTTTAVKAIHTKAATELPVKKAKHKAAVSLNNAAVKIYPDMIRRDMHVVAKENEGMEVDFFVFDLQGTLIQNVKMKAKDHIRLTGLARGQYIYRVFNGDEESAAGKFEIR